MAGFSQFSGDILKEEIDRLILKSKEKNLLGSVQSLIGRMWQKKKAIIGNG
jgi:hypothetical protein